MAFAAVMQGFELVFQRTVRVAGILARRRQRMGVNERMECGIRRIMREKAAAVRAQERVARACIAEGEQKIVRFLRVQQGGDDRRERLAGAEEEHRVRPLRARQQRAALRVGGEKGKRVGGVRRDGLMNIRCRHENLLKQKMPKWVDSNQMGNAFLTHPSYTQRPRLSISNSCRFAIDKTRVFVIIKSQGIKDFKSSPKEESPCLTAYTRWATCVSSI